MTISMIVAHDLNNGIGYQNTIPWELTQDMDFFRRMTIGKAVLMGKNTFESFNRKPLLKRLNIVLTSDKELLDTHIYGQSVDKSLKAIHSDAHFIDEQQDAENIAFAYNAHEEIMIIGGQKVYESLLPNTDRIYVTRIESEFEVDAYMPSYEENFERIYRSPEQSENDIKFRYEIWERK